MSTNTDPAGFDSEATGAFKIKPLTDIDSQPEDTERERYESSQFLTQYGMRVLGAFTIASDPASGGVRLKCAGGCPFTLPWPGHVLAPDLRHLSLLAQSHWNEAH